MLSFDFSWFATLYILTGLLLTLALWWYYDRRSAAIWQRQRRVRAYHCIKCGHLYQAPEGQTEAACPSCGFTQRSLRF